MRACFFERNRLQNETFGCIEVIFNNLSQNVSIKQHIPGYPDAILACFLLSCLVNIAGYRDFNGRLDFTGRFQKDRVYIPAVIFFQVFDGQYVTGPLWGLFFPY
jgi:hypothetical protein